MLLPRTPVCPVLVLVLAPCLFPPPILGGQVSPDIEAIAKGNNRFALDLYAELKDEPGNLVFSPLSISTAMAVAYGGAKGDTAREIADVMHFELEPRRFHAAWRRLSSVLKERAKEYGMPFTSSNAVCIQKDYRLKSGFANLISHTYEAVIMRCDFGRDSAGTCRRVNAWVSERTHGKIAHILAPDHLNALARLILVNCTYFRGSWVYQFDKSETRDQPFRLVTGDQVNIPMMEQTAEFRYYREPAMQIIALPYRGRELALIILLPSEDDGLPDLERRINTENLNTWIGNLREQPRQKVFVKIPRFKMRAGFRVTEPLKKLGLTQAFDASKADFSGISTRHGLYIWEVLHKAYIELNEEGTEAAATTTVTGGILGPSDVRGPYIPSFIADHPFLFMILDGQRNVLMFMGRFVNPVNA